MGNDDSVLNFCAEDIRLQAPIQSFRVLRFEDCEIDMRLGELRRNGHRITLPEQPFQVLAMLLARRGDLVTREELCRALWPTNTFIDFDDGLNAAVKRLRHLLGDSADKPRIVETIPRRGYRLICVVEELPQPADELKVDNGRNSDANHGDSSASGIEERNWQAEVAVARPSSRPFLLFGSRWRSAVASLVVLTLLGTWAAFRRLDRPQLAERDAVLLIRFGNKTGDPVFDETLKRAVAIDLGQSPYLNVYPDQKVRRTLVLMGRSPDEVVTAEIGREICQRAGIKAFLTGSISRLDTHYVMTLEAFNADSGDSLAQEQVEANRKEQIMEALGKATRKLRQELGESLRSIQKFDRPLEEVTTSSLEAFKAFGMGDLQHSKGEDLASVALYKRAIELDPNFALAYARLASGYQNLEQADLAMAFSEKAFTLKDRTSERENLYITAHYYAYRGMIERAIEAYEMYKHTFPDDFIPYNNLAVEYLALGQYEKAVENAQAVLQQNPDYDNGYVLAADAYLGLGRPADARSVLSGALRRNLDSWRIHETLARVALQQGDSAVLEHEEDLAKRTPDGELALLLEDANTAASRGRLQKAHELFGEAIRMAERMDLQELAGQSLLDLALTEVELGYSERVANRVATAMKIDGGWNTKVGAARVMVCAGRDTEALKLMKQVTSHRPDDTLIQSVLVPYIGAVIELNRKHAAQAIQMLASTKPYDLLDPTNRKDYANWPLLLARGSAYLQARRGAEAEQEFRRILDLRGASIDDYSYPLALVGLARAYVIQNDRAKARTRFEEFFTLWKDADSEIPLLKQAKREYARLG
jgi:DNA-binding winged helix-turn-helix (wHTH) protein/tetratricopeptide (TPR) repeat protein